MNAEAVTALDEINADCNVKWLTSFLSADRRKTYCLYEADSADSILEAARRANIPADAIVELSGEIDPASYR